ncbi:hypothetical protein HQ585_16445 [candidate division KSB1 bacterium]|nr:hypothetical protein [candidate division KSB1 bacterium]
MEIINWRGEVYDIQVQRFFLISIIALADAFDTIRQRRFEMLVWGPDIDENDPTIQEIMKSRARSASTRWESMNKSPNRTSICIKHDKQSQVGSKVLTVKGIVNDITTN